MTAEPAVLASLLAVALACGEREPVYRGCTDSTCSSVVTVEPDSVLHSLPPSSGEPFQYQVRACLGDDCATEYPTDLTSSVRIIIDTHFEARQRASLTVSRIDQDGARVLLEASTENPVGELVYANGEDCPPPPCLYTDLVVDGNVLAPV